MFCPNCGAQNPDNATTCQKCGFAMRGAAGPKFKGTMLMMNTPGGLVPGAASPGAPPPGVVQPGPGQHGAGQPAAVPPPGQASLPQAPPPADAAPAARQRLKGTMIGVAPPAYGAAAPYTPPVAQPAQQPPAPGPQPPAYQPPVYQAPAQEAARGYGALSPTTAMPAVGAPPTSAMSSFEPQAPRPTTGSINPLGGTLVAPPGGPQAWANPTGPGASPTANPEIPVDMRDSALMGSSPGGMPAFGAGPYGAAPAAGYGYEGVPSTQPGNPPMGSASALGGFTERPPWRVALFMILTCGIYGVLWFAWTADEMRAHGRELPPSWHLIIPILNIIWMWKWCVALEGVSNGEQSSATSFLLLFFLGPIGAAILQSKLNDL